MGHSRPSAEILAGKTILLEVRKKNLLQAYITEESRVLKNQDSEGDVLACHPEPVESTQKTTRLTQEALKT